MGAKVYMPNSAIYLDWKPIFEAYVVRCGSENQTKKTCV